MTLEKITLRIARWQAAMEATEKSMADLSAAVGCMAGSPLLDAIGVLQGLATRQLSELLGDADKLLEIWWTECSFGAKPLEVQLPGEDLREITTIEDLAKLIFDDLLRSKKESV